MDRGLTGCHARLANDVPTGRQFCLQGLKCVTIRFNEMCDNKKCVTIRNV